MTMLGTSQVSCNTIGYRWGVRISADQRYEGVLANVISITRRCGEGGGHINFPEKNNYITLESMFLYHVFPQV